MSRDIYSDLKTVSRVAGKYWIRGNLLIFSSIIIELIRKIIYFIFLEGNMMTFNNIILGITLFLAMLGGLDLFRTYTALSWIGDLVLSKSFSAIPNIQTDEHTFIHGVRGKNIMEGVFLTSLTFLLGIGLVLAVRKVNGISKLMGFPKKVSTIKCWKTVSLSCRLGLEEILDKSVHWILETRNPS